MAAATGSPELPAVLRYAASRNWKHMLIAARENPASLLVIDETSGHTALHYCARERAPDDTIRRLLSFDEGRRAISIPCREGSWTPIHLSCRAIASDESIEALARANPAAILIQDSDGDNVLHCALRNGASAEVLSILVDLAADVTYLDNPEVEDEEEDDSSLGGHQTTTVNSNPFLTADYGDGDAPIHSAIRHEAPTSIVELLLDAAPDCIDARNCELKTPLHVACEFERHDVIGVICQRVMDMPGRQEDLRSYLATEDWYGTTAVACLWDQYLDKCSSTSKSPGNSSSAVAIEPNSRLQIDLWESIVRLLTSAYYGQEVDFDPRCRSRSQVQMLVQAAIGMGDVCPPTLLKFLVRRYPIVFSTEDSLGNLPLVEAIIQAAADANSASDCSNDTPSRKVPPVASKSSPIARTSRARNSAVTTSSTTKHEKEYDVLHPSTSKILRENVINDPTTGQEEDPPSAVQIIIDAHPEAASKKDSNGHLPLALAALSGLPWKQGTEGIFRAHPRALGKRDEATGLHSFMLAATAPVENEIDQVDTIFNLLRLDPSAIRASDEERQSSSNNTGADNLKRTRADSIAREGKKRLRAC